MKLYFDILGFKLPSYGLMIVLGVVLSNLVALLMVKKKKHDSNDFIILEAYTFLGAFIGAKLLYILVSFKEIDWSRITDIDYFNQLMLGGFVFYGGLIGGLLLAFLAGKVHKIPTMEYVRSYIFLIPFIHCFGRIGCFLAGCCYGKPYDGIGAVCYPEGSIAPTGVLLFPVQLVEAVGLFVIAIAILILQLKAEWKYTIEMYLISYSILRFVLEYFRYDEARGGFAGLSTSQWISIGLAVVAVVSVLAEKRRKKKNCS